MISYTTYKALHFLGVFMVILSLGGLAMHSINGGTKSHAWRLPVALTHGIGMTLSLVAGFGLLARLGIVQNGFPGWVVVKLIIWLFFGVAIAILNRKPATARTLWYIIFLLAALAGFLANTKPF